MRIKDNFNRYIDIDLPTDLEAQAWQDGLMKYGYLDLSNLDQQKSEKNIFSKPIDNNIYK